MNEVQVKINDKKGSFFIEIDGKQEAEMTFVFAGEDKIIIDHTGVIQAMKEKVWANKWSLKR